MRLIDADAFKEYMWKALEETRGCYPDKGEWAEAITKQFCKDIDDQPAAQPEQRWIPCSERLPETHEAGDAEIHYMESDPVLVYGILEYESAPGFHVADYCDDLDGTTYWSTEMDAVTINGVKAWMPLPKPYKERREE